VTWRCEHIANGQVIRRLRKLNQNIGRAVRRFGRDQDPSRSPGSTLRGWISGLRAFDVGLQRRRRRWSRGDVVLQWKPVSVLGFRLASCFADEARMSVKDALPAARVACSRLDDAFRRRPAASSSGVACRMDADLPPTPGVRLGSDAGHAMTPGVIG